MNWYKAANRVIGVINKIESQDIELMQQDKSYTCGPATIQNLFRIMGKEIPAEDDLADQMNTTKAKGTAPESLEAWLHRHGVPVIRIVDDGELEGHLQKNRIVIVEYQDYQEQNPIQTVINVEASHYAMIVGYDDATYYLADPYLHRVAGTKRTIKRVPKDQFHKDWLARSFDGKRIVRDYGLVVPI